MAGDWIKMEHATLDKPEVLRAAEMLGMSRDGCLGLFFRYWVWLDRNLSGSCPESVRNMSGSCPDVVRHVSRKSLDDVLQCAGFAAVLEAIGWAKFNDDGWTLQVVNADRHNGNTAKTRALDSKRKAEQRLDSVRKMSGSEPDKNRTREEKSIKTPIVPSTQSVHKPAQASVQENEQEAGFIQFWKTWPSNPRKVNRKGCLEKWRKENLDDAAQAIIPHVEAMKRTEQWAQFCPLPMTYLNQRRWEDGTPTGTTPDDERAKKVAWALG